MNTQAQDPEDISRFLVDNAELIRGIFDGMLERRVFIALSIPHEEGSQFMSMLSSIEGRTITFDLPADPALTGQVLRHGKLNASAQDGGVQVQFRLSEIQRSEYDGRACFTCALPADLYRIQRRNAYRVPVPLHDEVTCDVVFSDRSGKPVTRRLRVFDLSISGLTLLMPLDIPELPTDTVLSTCTLRMPDTEPLNVQLIVRNSFALPTRNDNIRRRVGCEFAELPGSVENRLQRYIFKIERILRSKSHP